MKKELLVIYYHEVVERGKGNHYQKIELSKFELQMRYLHDNGYNTIFFSELSKPLPPKPIVVSFDDGFRSVFQNAFPVMKKYQIKGNVYLPTRYIGEDCHFMDWIMIRDMVESGLFEMQAHTHEHRDIRTLSKQELFRQIELSDECFHQNIGVLPEAFCIPFGNFNRKSLAYLKKANRYRYLLGSFYGRTSQAKLQSHVLPRIGISNNDDMETFVKKLNGGFDWKGPLQRLRLSLNNLKGERITEYEY